MNIFKSLDYIFPVTPARAHGEVVSVSIRVFADNVDLGEINMKRKAWYVNASVNAFHMHRALVRDFTENIRGVPLDRKAIRRAKRLIALAVLYSYLQNRETDAQYYEYFLSIDSDTVSMDWVRFDAGYLVHIIDVPEERLASLVDISVAHARQRLAS